LHAIFSLREHYELVSAPEDPDVLAMSRLREGDDLALNDIMDRWQSRLTGYLLRLTGNEAIAVDLAEETFVRVYESRSRYRPTAAFSTWLFAIASNLARHHIRWRLRHPTVSADAPAGASGHALDNIQAADPDPRARLEQVERAAAVRGAIADLAPELREALILLTYEDMSYEQIAAIQRCSTKAVETRLYRARAVLRKKLARWLSD
jgi:RNA polymerase sigma-70 factor (ECF subfamily)